MVCNNGKRFTRWLCFGLAASLIGCGQNSGLEDTADFAAGDEAKCRVTGDANDDKQFDQFDIVQVMRLGKYRTGEPAEWSFGDWNNDGYFDQLDITTAMQAGQWNVPREDAVCQYPLTEAYQQWVGTYVIDREYAGWQTIMQVFPDGRVILNDEVDDGMLPLQCQTVTSALFSQDSLQQTVQSSTCGYEQRDEISLALIPQDKGPSVQCLRHVEDGLLGCWGVHSPDADPATARPMSKCSTDPNDTDACSNLERDIVTCDMPEPPVGYATATVTTKVTISNDSPLNCSIGNGPDHICYGDVVVAFCNMPDISGFSTDFPDPCECYAIAVERDISEAFLRAGLDVELQVPACVTGYIYAFMNPSMANPDPVLPEIPRLERNGIISVVEVERTFEPGTMETIEPFDLTFRSPAVLPPDGSCGF